MAADPAFTDAMRCQLRGGPADQAIAALAATQHDVFSRRQLLTLGIGERSIDRRLSANRIRRVHRGVYTVRQSQLHRDGWWMAAVLLGGDGAVLTHRAGGAFWGIRRDNRRRIEVTVPRERRQCKAVHFHWGRLQPDEYAVRNGIPVTGVNRTIFDLAAVVPPAQVEAAIAEAEVRRLTDSVSIHELLMRYPCRPGAGALRAILGTGASRTRSELEIAFLELISRSGLPRPETNVWLPGLGIEADCLWREQRLIVELDSRAVHLTAAAFESDRARDRAAAVAGWRTIRVTWAQVHDPDQLVADLRVLLGESL
jgi:hypothetical protein